MRTLFLDALKGKNRSGAPPIWLMRQAGRYLPEYRALRKKYSFSEMYQTPELVKQVTYLPLTRYDLDAAILFCDILVILQAMGRQVTFVEGTGPVIDPPFCHPKELLHRVEPVDLALGFVREGIRAVLSDVHVPLIGFAGGPFTVASYLIEGRGTSSFSKVKKWLWNDPKTFLTLLDQITDLTIEYLKMQVLSGVHALQVFDSWADLLSRSQFQVYCLPYLKKIIDALKGNGVPLIVFCRGSCSFVQELIGAAPDGISFDWKEEIGRVRSLVPPHIGIQGNIDPDVLLAPHAQIKKGVNAVLCQTRYDPRYIFNLGHGIKPNVDPAAVAVMVERVKRGWEESEK